MKHIIDTIEEYEYAKSRGFDPLLSPYIDMDIQLRIEVQKKVFGHCVFGRGNIPKANDRYYHFMWDIKPNYCENCLTPLPNYSAVFISHIFSRKAKPEMAHDPRNSNKLCFNCHTKWESDTCKIMRIYPANKKVMELLIKEY